MYLLDTNVVSEFRKSVDGRINHGVKCWAEGIFPELMFLSAISILELEISVLQIERRDQKQGAILRKWLDHNVMPTFAERVLPINLAVARRYAALQVPNPKSERDTMIVATALEHSMTIVTRNVADFEHSGVKVFDPWS